MNSTTIEEGLDSIEGPCPNMSTRHFTSHLRYGRNPHARENGPRAQVTEHLAIAYELAAQFLEGTSGIPGRKPPRLLRPLLRTLIRMTVLRTGRFLKGKTPAAFEPSPYPAPQRALRDRLRHASELFEQKARERSAPESTSSSTRTLGASGLKNSCDFGLTTHGTTGCRLLALVVEQITVDLVG
jgi:hypothetical protein